MEMTDGESLWERHAAWWQKHFTDGADPEYEEQILPLVADRLASAHRILDVGCGEGQVSRWLARPGVDVVGVDPTSSQVRAANERDPRIGYAQARAEQLPFAAGSFDALVICLALEHVGPFESAIREVARVLAPDGRFLLLLVHPILQAPGSGWLVADGTGETFWKVGSYLEDDFSVDEVAPGINLPFAHRALSRYVHAMGTAGLFIDDMVEPVPPADVLVATGGFEEASSIPRFMLLSARRSVDS